MFAVKPSRDESLELHAQIAGQIRKAIADGEANPGERLPPARDLAAELGVNRNTVLRALRDLRDEGLVDFKRGRGVVVTGSADHSVVVERARELVALGRRHGYVADDLLEMVARAAQAR
jgi:GntR family transcriptional regulator